MPIVLATDFLQLERKYQAKTYNQDREIGGDIDRETERQRDRETSKH